MLLGYFMPLRLHNVVWKVETAVTMEGCGGLDGCKVSVRGLSVD